MLIALLLAFAALPEFLPVSAGFAGKIKHVIVVMEENRSFDHKLGWASKILGTDGLTGDEYNLVNTSDPNSKRIYVDSNMTYVAPCDPNHGTDGTTEKIFGKAAFEQGNLTAPTMCGFAETEGPSRDYCSVLSGIAPEKVPVMITLAQEYAIMDRFFCSHPGPTWPNRLFALAASAEGCTSTGEWGGDVSGGLYTAPTIFDQVANASLEWRNYVNDTPWELFIESIAHNPDNVRMMDDFFYDARTGNLPAFAWINPRSGVNLTTGVGSNDEHPDHDVAAAEAFYKDIYEALRNSPQWNETLFIITYDEHGGYYDHVPTPMGVPPPSPPPSPKAFPFDRQGVRIPTLLISPWIARGTVITEPPPAQRPTPNSEYDLTSILATARILLGMPTTNLTARDAWAATFEHVIGDTLRTDTLVHLPDVPVSGHDVKAEARLPLNGLQEHIARQHALVAGVDPDHKLSTQGQVSEWLMEHYSRHAAKTTRWIASKNINTTTLFIRSRVDGHGSVSSHWNMNVSTEGIVTAWINLEDGTALCLDSGAGSHLPKSRHLHHAVQAHERANVTVSVCYDRDVSQKWVWDAATLRPASNLELCVTMARFQKDSTLSDGDDGVYMSKCINSLQQHIAFHGPSPGNDNTGELMLGDDEFDIAVYNITGLALSVRK